jgi:hypothetical protein
VKYNQVASPTHGQNFAIGRESERVHVFPAENLLDFDPLFHIKDPYNPFPSDSGQRAAIR